MDTEKVKEMEQQALSLADTMAAATAQFTTHNYSVFLESREALINILREMVRLIS